MRRFDALAQHKAAVRSIFRDMQSDPATAVCLMPAFFNSMAWSLELAGIQAAGPGGLLRIKGLGLIYISGISVWLDDDSPDLSVTMARIDRDLRRVEGMMNLVSWQRQTKDSAE